MKCPYCGAEIPDNSQHCDYCGSQITSKMQKEREVLNKKHCPKCNSTNIKFTRENQSEIFVKNAKYTVNKTVGVCNDCGYTWSINEDNKKPKSRKTWLWVLGWIFVFPVPLTILMKNNKKLNKNLRIAIIVCAWVLYLLIAVIGNNKNDSTTSNGANNTGNGATVSTENETQSKSDVIDKFVTKYNESSPNQLIFNETFIVQDSTSSHYKTEFRLNAYEDALGKSYKINDTIVDIVVTEGSVNKSIDTRIYVDGTNLDQCVEIIKYASPLLDKSMSEKTLEDAISYVTENKEANGYQYGELSLVLLGSDPKGYDMMIATD